MKKNYILSILFLMLTISINAQTFKIDTTAITYENKLRPCLSSNVDPESKTLKKAWKSYLKSTFKIKLKNKSGRANKDIFYAEDVFLNTVSAKRMNVYTRIVETANGSEMKLFGSFGYDFFIGTNNYPAEFKAMGKIMNDFLYEYLSKHYNDEIKAVNKRIKSLSKEKISLLKTTEKNKKKIANSKDDIDRLNDATGLESDKSIKNLEKINSLTHKQIDLENENAKALIEVKTIEEKLVLRKLKLEKLKSKQQGLIN